MKHLKLLLMITFSTWVFPGQAAVVEMDREEVIQRSEMIFVGQVLSKQARWNDRGNLIVTDYEFAVDEVMFGDFTKDTLELTFAGGQLPEEGQSLSDVPEFAVAEEVLLMLESHSKPLFSPVTGLYQGKFSAGHNRNSVVGGLGEIIQVNRKVIDFATFIEQVRQEIPVAKAKPLPHRVNNPTNQFPSRPYAHPGHTFQSTGTTLPATAGPDHQHAPQQATAAMLNLAEHSTDLTDLVPDFNGQRWSYDHRAKFIPINFNPLPGGGLLGNHDQFQMAYWNQYANIFQVYANPSNTWAWQNGIYEIAGFVNNQTMIDQFGQGWGANTLAICWLRWDGSGFSIEADIALNPAYSWSVDDYSTYDNPGVWNANRTLSHEIGHAWGLQHQFEELSVMNYAPKKYRAYNVLYADDVMAVRTAFPTAAVAQTDFSISLFHSPGHQFYADATLSSNVLQAGDNFTVSNFVLENSGTTSASATINWYLTPNINDWTNAFYIGNTNSGTMNPDSFFHLDNVPLGLPANTPAGSYFLAAHIATAADNVPNNNSSWLDRNITVMATQTCADDGWENMGSGGTDDFCSGSHLDFGFTQAHLHCDADWIHFNGQTGATYRIETKNLNGGADTNMSLRKECGSQLAFDDDGGSGLASRIDFQVASDGRFDVRIGQHNEDYANGEYYEVTVTCLSGCNDVIFTSGFD
ncbi:matrixin family metalloprotease [Marinicella meishanensis]|uniref:matrixin family metalloprotease n=1 Tax=Marinicella meishanensis TaxID=2873263 RepID=UPI001CBD5F83|nr:matrixin family metalloprotease [Marinicella sp. NBU2979]